VALRERAASPLKSVGLTIAVRGVTHIRHAIPFAPAPHPRQPIREFADRFAPDQVEADRQGSPT
jgi:hypothetical protein